MLEWYDIGPVNYVRLSGLVSYRRKPGGIEARPGTEKRCSHNLQSGLVKTWTAVFVIINISN